MLFQSKQLGLTGQWSAIKRAYYAANRILGDVIKVHTQARTCNSLSRLLSDACTSDLGSLTDSSHGAPTTSALDSLCGPCLNLVTCFVECFSLWHSAM